MREPTRIRHLAARDAVFVVCALCTVWLLLQNTILLSLLAWQRSVIPMHAATSAARALFAAALPFALIPFAFVLGWQASRPRHPIAGKEVRHER